MAGSPSEYDDVVEDGREGPVLRIRVRPRSSRRGVLGASAGWLTVGVGAAPVGGKATAEAIKAVAGWLDLAPSGLLLVSGAAARAKRLRVVGETAEGLRRRVAAGLEGTGERRERRPRNRP
ncbi:MAG: DUF167 domain-containing protein [Actinomycetota bacterium]